MFDISILEKIAYKNNENFSPYWDLMNKIVYSWKSKMGHTTEEEICKYIRKVVTNGKVIHHGTMDLTIETDKSICVFEIKASDNHDNKKREGEVRALMEKGAKLANGSSKQLRLIIYFLDTRSRKNEHFYKENGIEALYGQEIFSKLGEKEELYLAMKDEIEKKCPLRDVGPEYFNLDNEYDENAKAFYRKYKKKAKKILDRIGDGYWEFLSPDGKFLTYCKELLGYGDDTSIFNDENN